jgi:predicted methyltransferase MtxX (methanogen marker protein 4)
MEATYTISKPATSIGIWSRFSQRRRHDAMRLIDHLGIDTCGKVILRNSTDRQRLAAQLGIDLDRAIDALVAAGAIAARYIGRAEILELRERQEVAA